ncbi:MAG TPA: hypothetical protein VGM54_24775 [Chthoniobacter sp.]|jgi:hypothetical protein
MIPSPTISPAGQVAPRPPFQLLACVFCFVAGLVLASFAIGRCLPFPDVPGIRQKLAWLGKHGDDFDVVFIGSSRVEQQIIPEEFDRTAASLGHPVRSFNAGMAAMVPPEDSYVLEQILQRPHRRLRWVFLEIMPLGGQFDAALAGTGRMDYWHDIRRMELLTQRAIEDVSRTWERPKTAQSRYEELSHIAQGWSGHLQSFVTRGTNLGRGSVLLTSHFRHGKKTTHYDDAGPRHDGWVPAKPLFMSGKLLDDYERQFAALSGNPSRHTADPLSEDALRSNIELLRRHGIETILFLPPTLANSQFFPTGSLRGVPVFDFSDIDRYPELYATGNHKDGVHLNLAGAEIFSRELASLFAGQTKAVSR